MLSLGYARLGGISGLLFVILVLPSYLSAPDSPVATSSPQEVIDYFGNRQDGILTNNGLLLVFAAFFFLFFLGALYGVLRGAEGEGHGLAAVSLAGGLLFVALVLAGAAVEIAYPATLARFESFREGAQLGFFSLALSGWMYRFAFVGMSALIAAASLMVLRTGILPNRLAWGGFVAALAALLRLLGPLAGWLALLWLVAASVSCSSAPADVVRPARARRARLDGTSRSDRGPSGLGPFACPADGFWALLCGPATPFLLSDA